ncbi:MAG: hypothetical protein LC624_05550 [Halobacteriales archaeon]|nr:hypothetical protein [Halobacteriales archaeon]
MVRVDRWFVVGVVGVALSLVLLGIALAGEVLGWWGDLGVLLAIVSFAGTVVFGLVAASRFQVERLGAKLDEGFGRVEQGIGRVEVNTHESVALLREIRDRLPPHA